MSNRETECSCIDWKLCVFRGKLSAPNGLIRIRDLKGEKRWSFVSSNVSQSDSCWERKLIGEMLYIICNLFSTYFDTLEIFINKFCCIVNVDSNETIFSHDIFFLYRKLYIRPVSNLEYCCKNVTMQRCRFINEIKSQFAWKSTSSHIKLRFH